MGNCGIRYALHRIAGYPLKMCRLLPAMPQTALQASVLLEETAISMSVLKRVEICGTQFASLQSLPVGNRLSKMSRRKQAIRARLALSVVQAFKENCRSV